jgi:RimJ/RimL family protein N-acetyltransferase
MPEVRIRPLREEDARTSWRWRNDADLWVFTGSRPDVSVTEEIEKEWIEKVIRDPRSRRFAIIVSDNGEEVYVGNIQLTDISRNSAQYHVFIGEKNYWGKRIGSRATILLLDYAFRALSLDSVWLEVRRLNSPALHLYTKIGFQVISEQGGTLRMEISRERFEQNISNS